MKKALIILLSLCVLTLYSCGDNPLDDLIPAISSGDESNTDAKAEEATIEETLLLDEAGIKITAKELGKGLLGTELSLLIENNSEKNIIVQARNTSVNGYMAETMMSENVAVGKKANSTLTFTNLDDLGIETVADMEFALHIIDSDTWEGYLDSEIIKLETSAASSYEYKFDDSGVALFEDNGIKIVSKGVDEDTILGKKIVYYVYNSTDAPITVQTRDVSINGFMVSAIASQEVMPGKHAIADITFLSSDLENNEITTIENAELSFHIFNAETWDTIVDTPAISLAFSE